MPGLIKDFRTVSRIAAANLLGRRHPLSVTFISTYRCNFTCEYCDVWRLRDAEMTTDEAISMIDEFASLGTRRFTFDGGEPLLRDDIGELIGHCKKRGIFTTMFSNGSLVEPNIGRLKDLDLLVVSLDGPPGVHDRQRMRGTHSQVMDGIRAARAIGLDVWTNTVITKDNIDYLTDLVELVAGLGVKMLFQPVLHYSHSSDSSRISHLASGAGDYLDAIAALKELKRKGAPIVHSGRYLDYIKLPVWSMNRRKCWASRLYCAVTPTGEVAPCYPLFYSRRWPNGLEKGFEKAFRELKMPECPGCYSARAESDFLYSFKIGPVVTLFEASGARLKAPLI